MSGILHKAEDALHIHHHDKNKPTEHGEHAKQPDAHAGMDEISPAITERLLFTDM